MGVLVVVALFGWVLLGREMPASRCIEPHLEAIPSPMPQENPQSVTPSALLAVPVWWKPQLDSEQQSQYENITLNHKFYSAQDILVYKNQVGLRTQMA